MSKNQTSPHSDPIAILDKICRNHTAFSSFDDLLDTEGYRPSIDMRESWGEHLADAYDEMMGLRDDRRRAFRYGLKMDASETTACLILRNERGVAYGECVVACDDSGDFRLSVLAALRHMVLHVGDTITLELV